MASALQLVAGLNRSGRLAKPLQYAAVKEALAEAGEEAALRILRELDEQAEEVLDPVEFVKAAVASCQVSTRVRSGAPPAEVPAFGKRKAEGPAAGPGHGGGMVAKRLRLLNNSGRLQKLVAFEQVEGPLGSLGMARAMTILQALEDAAEDIRDPTAYVRTAVRSAGGVAPEEVEEEEEERNWYVQATPGGEEDALEDDEVEIEVEEVEEEPHQRSRQGSTQASFVPRGVKAEPGARPWTTTKEEELSESDRIARRVDWLNRNAGLSAPVQIELVVPLLESIGFRQAMRVLRRLEESGAETADPNEFIRDLIGRSGWIWAKPDVIDDDQKVAKRVAWLNEFGCLKRKIEWAEVADILDGLRVPHAMVLLRELEMQGNKVADPTAYIKRTAGLAGEDDIQMPADDPNSAVQQRIAELNSGGTLAAAIDLADVGDDLGRIGEDDAMQLLQEVADKGASVRDPTGYIRFKLRAKLASVGSSLAPSDDGTKILKRVEWLNDYGGLLQDIDYDKVSSTLESVGIDHAMTILKELEDQREGVRNPTTFILNSARSSWKRAAASDPAPKRLSGAAFPAPDASASKKRSLQTSSAPAPARGGRAQTTQAPATQLEVLNDFMSFLGKSPAVKRQVRLSEIAGAVDALGTARALRVLKEMQERGLGLDDPVSYIKAAAQRHSPGVKKESTGYEEPEEVDDVSKLTSRLTWLNQFAGLSRKIIIDEVVGALYCLGLLQSMSILRGLQERGSDVDDPTRYIKTAVQRANMASVLGEVKDEDAEDEDEAEGDDAGASEEEDAGEEVEQEAEEEAADEDGQWDNVEEEDGWEEPKDELDPAGFEWDEEEKVQTPPTKKSGGSVSSASKLAARDAAKEAAAALAKKRNVPKRVVGALTGYTQLVPTRAQGFTHQRGGVKREPTEAPLEEGEEANVHEEKVKSSRTPQLPVTPQEKMVQVRDYALKNELHLDAGCLKAMARLPFYRAKDMIDDVLLGGRNRQGVQNPSRYLMGAVQKLSMGLGVEQGIAMELAVTLGVVLNNDALDELACIPRKESHAIMRELSKNPEVRSDPLRYIKNEVLKCRAQMDARPFGS
ncbi:unnamed protein product [Polarella glacialis]|uniref:Uncharacterized protein n=2 Tax=Polarella glacialis TaxID=89957 RepID=A0A813KRY1_POLGL|nr:unnamed protein product [Polarella glacialis]